MVDKFIWEADIHQTYNINYGSQVVSQYPSDDYPLWKWGGGGFTMNAKGETLTLYNKGDNYRWPDNQPNVSSISSTVLLNHGTVLATYENPNAVGSSFFFGGEPGLSLNIANDSSFEIIDSSLIYFGFNKNNTTDMELNMSGDASFQIKQTHPENRFGITYFGGVFDMSDNSAFSCESCTLIRFTDFKLVLSENSRFSVKNSRGSIILNNNTIFNITQSNCHLEFLSDDKNFPPIDIKRLNMSGVINFHGSNTENMGYVKFSYMGNNESINKILNTGMVSIDGTPQYDSYRLDFIITDTDLYIKLK